MSAGRDLMHVFEAQKRALLAGRPVPALPAGLADGLRTLDTRADRVECEAVLAAAREVAGMLAAHLSGYLYGRGAATGRRDTPTAPAQTRTPLVNRRI